MLGNRLCLSILLALALAGGPAACSKSPNADKAGADGKSADGKSAAPSAKSPVTDPPPPPAPLAWRETGSFACPGQCKLLRFTADGTGLIVADDGYTDPAVRVHEFDGGAKRSEVKDSKSARSFAVSPDASKVAVIAGTGPFVLTLFEPATGSQTVLKRWNSQIPKLRFSRDGRILAALDSTVELFDLAGNAWRTPLRSGFAAAVSADGALAAFSMPDGSIPVVNTITGNGVATITPKAGRMEMLAFSPDGRLLAGGCRQRHNSVEPTTFLWRIPFKDADNGSNNGKVETALAGPECQDLAFTPEGRTLLGLAHAAPKPGAGKPDGSFIAWDVATGASRTLATGVSVHKTRTPLDVAFVNDRLFAMDAVFDGVMVFDLASLQPVSSMAGQGMSVGALSPDGKRLAVAESQKVRLFEAVAGGQ